MILLQDNQAALSGSFFIVEAAFFTRRLAAHFEHLNFAPLMLFAHLES